MKNVVVATVVLGIIGLVVGYFLFARLGNGYVPLTRLFESPHGLLGRIANALTNTFVVNLHVVRRNILLSGVVGVVAGFGLGILSQRRR